MTCDARMFTSSGQHPIQMSQQINVLSKTVLLLPQYAQWNWDLRDGLSDGIRQYNGSSLVGTAPGGGGGQMILSTGSSMTNMEALYATAPAAGNKFGYLRASGFFATNILRVRFSIMVLCTCVMSLMKPTWSGSLVAM